MDTKARRSLLFIAIVALVLPLSAQTTWCWRAADLSMTFPFHVDSLFVEEDSEEFWMDADVLELELLRVPKDSIPVTSTDLFTSMLEAIVSEYDLIVLSGPAPIDSLPEGKYLIALDTLVFTDTVVVMAFSNKNGFVIAGVIDCYEVPVSTGKLILNSFRFSTPACRDEE
jgi:hypothetical protein